MMARTRTPNISLQRTAPCGLAAELGSLVAPKWVRRLFTGGVVVCLLVGCSLGSLRAADDSHHDYKLSGFGGYPISDSITSMWLAEPKGKPLVMAFFSGGPPGWQNRKWQTNSNFQKDGPGWAECSCDKATQRLWLDPETGSGEVQKTKVDVHQSNVFLVLNVTGPAASQKIVPLGVFDLPKSGDHPASDQLLRDHPDLQEKILKEIANGKGN